MREKYKNTHYPSGNIKTETYQEDDTFVTKLFYNEKNAYVEELTHLKDGIKEIKYFTRMGVLSKMDHFVDDKRHGLETKYLVSKANKSVKSTKMYYEGKLHGECITYNELGEIIKTELFEHGKCTKKS